MEPAEIKVLSEFAWNTHTGNEGRRKTYTAAETVGVVGVDPVSTRHFNNLEEVSLMAPASESGDIIHKPRRGPSLFKERKLVLRQLRSRPLPQILKRN